MAVHCPAYDPMIGWYIMVFGPNGPKKQLITSPLQYYHSLGVSPPVGAVFSNDDNLEFEEDLAYKKENYLDYENPLVPMPKLSSNLHENSPVIELGLPMLSTLPKHMSNIISQHAPMTKPEIEASKGLLEKNEIATFSGNNESMSSFYLDSLSNPSSAYDSQFSALLYNQHKNNTSSSKPLPSTSNIFPALHISNYVSFNKNPMSSSKNNYNDNDYKMEICYDDPYGEPHNM